MVVVVVVVVVASAVVVAVDAVVDAVVELVVVEDKGVVEVVSGAGSVEVDVSVVVDITFSDVAVVVELLLRFFNSAMKYCGRDNWLLYQM